MGQSRDHCHDDLQTQRLFITCLQVLPQSPSPIKWFHKSLGYSGKKLNDSQSGAEKQQGAVQVSEKSHLRVRGVSKSPRAKL